MLVRSTKAGFGDWDAVRDQVTYTDRFKEMLGYPSDADTSAWPSIFEMMHPDDRKRAREQFRAMIRRKSQGGEQEPGEPMSYRLRRRDGRYIWIHAEGVSQVDDDGRTRRFITSYLDVTAFREQEEALKENVRLREEVERIGRHDLKTPLASIVAVPRLLRESGNLTADQSELLTLVERAGYRVLNMVNLSLDLLKMEQGSYRFRPQPLNVARLLHKVNGDIRNHAASKQVAVQVFVDGMPAAAAPPVFAWAEETLCYSILANLLKNAVEAAPEGSAVTIAVEARDDEVLLRIHNRGAVPEAVRSRFFEKYATAGKAGGTGFGTYSARLMARIQEGDIAMRTSEEDGTTLTLRLQAAPDDIDSVRTIPGLLSEPSASHADALPPLKVLVVEDDEYSLLVMRRFLPAPLEVATAVNGRAALDAVAARTPDVILMDLEMPVMNGFEAVAQLRERERAARSRPSVVIGLSSHDDDDTRSRSLRAGFDFYLTKPVTQEDLHRVLRGLSGSAAIHVAPDDAVDAPPDADDVAVLDPDLKASLPGFLASRRAAIDEMQLAMAQGRIDEVQRLAHRLAGSFALYGLRFAARGCQQIERHAASGETAQIGEHLSALQRHLATVRIRFRDGEPYHPAQPPTAGTTQEPPP